MKNKFKTIELPEMVGKTLQEVKDYLEKTYPGQLAKQEHQEEFEKTKPDTSDWRWFYFFGSLRNSDGYWYVPYVHWNGSEFYRNADWLGDEWFSDFRVVLLETFEKVEPLKPNLNYACLGIPGCDHPVGNPCDCECHKTEVRCPHGCPWTHQPEHWHYKKKI